MLHISWLRHIAPGRNRFMRWPYLVVLLIHTTAGAQPTSQEDTRVIFRVFHAPNSTEIAPEQLETLRRTTELTKRLVRYSILIEGHSDSTGTAAANLLLSERRALNVRSKLSSLGIPQEYMTAVGRGFDIPFIESKSRRSEPQNRRTEIIITGASKDIYETAPSATSDRLSKE